MHTKEKPTMAVVGDNGNGKESVNTNIAQNDIENLLETSFNKNDYSRIVGLIRQEPTEVFREGGRDYRKNGGEPYTGRDALGQGKRD